MLLYMWYVVLPFIGAMFSGVLDEVMGIAITIFGIVLIFGAVGVRISANLGSTIVNGVFRGVGMVATGLGRAIYRIARTIPRVYTYTRHQTTLMGMSPLGGNLISMGVMALYILILI